eukprot:1260150-Rhodomonas_salina.2
MSDSSVDFFRSHSASYTPGPSQSVRCLGDNGVATTSRSCGMHTRVPTGRLSSWIYEPGVSIILVVELTSRVPGAKDSETSSSTSRA